MSEASNLRNDLERALRDSIIYVDQSKLDDVVRMLQDKPEILVQNVREYGLYQDESLVMVLMKHFKFIQEIQFSFNIDCEYYGDCDPEPDSEEEDCLMPSWSAADWKLHDHEKKKEELHPGAKEKFAQAVKLAVEAWPEAVHDVNKFGQTVLHIACECGAPDEIIALLQQQSPKMMETKDNFGHFPPDCADARKLRLAGLDRQWSQFMTLLDNNPDIAMVRFVKEGERFIDHSADTILHLIVRRKFSLRQHIPYGIFQALLSKCPQLAKVDNSVEGCPLNIAMYYGADEETIVDLLRTCPESTKISGYEYANSIGPDAKSGLPIEMALKWQEGPPGVLKAIAEASIDIKLEDSKAMELLTVAVRRDPFVLEAVMAILKASPRAATQRNIDAEYPLFSLMGRYCGFDVFERIFDLYPEVLSIRDLNGKSLLHVAYENHAPKEIIDKIQEMRKELMSERDLYGRLPKDMTSSKSNEIFVPMTSCLLLSDTNGFRLPIKKEQQDDDIGRVVLCQKNMLQRDPSPEQKGDWILWNKTFGRYFNDQLKARAMIFKTLVEEFANLVQLKDTKVIQRAAVLQALACQHLSQGENTMVDLSSLKQEGYWYQQEVLKLVMRIYNEDVCVRFDYEPNFAGKAPAIFYDGSNCKEAIECAYNREFGEDMHRLMSEPTDARIACFVDLMIWMVDGIESEDFYDIAGPNRKSLQSLFNKFYIRRGQTKVNILGDATRATLAIKDTETLLKLKERIEEHFPSIIPGDFQSPDTLGTIGFVEYIHQLPKVPGTNIIPYRFKPNGSQKKQNTDNPLWFNLNFFDGIPEYHRSGNSEIFVAFELQIGLAAEIEKHRKSHVAYERDRILEGQPCLRNYIDLREKILHNQPLLQNHLDGELETSTCTAEDIAIINNVLEGKVATEGLTKVKDVVFNHVGSDAPSSSEQHEESPKRLCLNNKQFNMMSTKTLAGPFSLDPTRRYFVHSLSTEFDVDFVGSVGLYAHVGPYRVEVAVGTKPRFNSLYEEHREKNRQFRVRNIVKPGNNYAFFERVCSIPPGSTAVDLTVTGSGICEKMELVLHEFVVADEDSWPVASKVE